MELGMIPTEVAIALYVPKWPFTSTFLLHFQQQDNAAQQSATTIVCSNVSDVDYLLRLKFRALSGTMTSRHFAMQLPPITRPVNCLCTA
jgi:hypothetical protein